ncbi:MAG: efflux RND transporter periplasmic adaptor subunit [Micavibrio sp.]|nr:efflux RND transporter periplasmic adaptor subunit [Micavibrio sp.]
MSTSKPKTKLKLFLFLIVCAVIAAYGITIRARAERELKQDTESSAIPYVTVIQPKVASNGEELILPGRVEAWHEASIYARTSGYIGAWTTDIGSHVKTGDVLATIETPEIDAQLRQAQANLATAVANNTLAQSTAKRWTDLLKTDSVTKQESDEKTSDAMAKAADVAAAQANLDHLTELESFKRITAPFDGVITARNIDTGALVNAGAGAEELFHIVEKDKLRVYVEVPQNYTQRLTADTTAELHFAEYPGRGFPAKMSRNASALDASTRTLRVEFSVDNSSEELLPGGYTEVHMKVATQASTMRLPVNTLLYRVDGVLVAILDKDGAAHLKPVTLGRDFGTEVEVTAGIDAGESVIVNPADSLVDGQKLRLAEQAPPKPADAPDAKGDKK